VVAAPLAVAVGETVPHGAGEHDTVQVTPLFVGSLVTVAVNGAVAPTSTVAEVGATETVVPGTVTLAELDTEVSATGLAVTTTDKSPAGRVPGAVYVVATPLAVAVGETVPHGAAEHDTVQVTPLFVESLATVAVNWAVVPAWTVAVGGVTETETGVAGILMVAEAAFDESAPEVAVIVTVRSPDGGVVGAV
jgi:hypothetical protein